LPPARKRWLQERDPARFADYEEDVATLSLTVSEAPTQSELQAVANKLDELINSLRR
jgi:hypothetical protein